MAGGDETGPRWNRNGASYEEKGSPGSLAVATVRPPRTMAEPTRPEDAVPIASFDDLYAPFFGAMKPPSEFRIGAEAEKFGVFADGTPIAYDGDRGVRKILEELASRFGWVPGSERPGGPLIYLTRDDGASVTLEPGAQLELSGAPLATIHEIADETAAHLDEVRQVSEPLGIRFLGLGFHPFARQDDLPWVPKSRYGIMKKYLPTRGAHGHDMMRRTATVQANFDYETEASAMRVMRVALRLSPVVTAMFANSPFYEGRAFGGKSYRAKAWLDVEPARQGLVPSVIRDGSKLSDYIEWALDAPMFLVLRPESTVNDGLVENTGQSFRSFWKDGFEGHRATRADWLTHLNTMFPEVRLKKTIEVRGADSQSRDLATALSALWTGLLYDPRAFDAAEALVEGFGHDELAALRPDVAERALGATFRGQPLAKLAESVVEVARGGLERRGRLRSDGADETVHLAPLARLVARGRCPADDLLDALAGDAGPSAFRERVGAASRLT
jgi:glutamate--cysteine ligase